MDFKKIGTIFISWRILLFLVGAMAGFFVAYQPSFPYAFSILPSYNLPQWLYSWANFDGVHYLTITKNGYVGTGLVQAFFPLYPVLISLLAKLLNPQIAGLLISNLSFLAVLVVWQLLVSLDYSKKITRLSLVLLLIFPTSFYFGALYSESLFLLLVLGSFWAVRKQHILLAMVLVALASATRIVGIFLLPALVLDLFIQYLQKKRVSYTWPKIRPYVLPFMQKHWRSIGLLALSSVGLLSYMLYLYVEFQDPLYFFHVQAEFGAGRQETLILFPQVVWRYLKILVTYQPHNLKYFAFVQEFGISLLALATLFYGLLRIRWSYLLFSFCAFFLPSLTGTLSSMPRYVLVCFPLFIIFAEFLASRKKLTYIWIIISTFWLAFNTILFIQGYWVA